MWDASGHTRWTYDIRGRIIKEEKWIDGAYYKTEWTYDAMDRVVTMKYPDDEVVTYTYNSQLLLDSVSGSVVGNIASDLAYNALDLPTAIKFSNAVSDLYLRYRYYGSNLDYSTTPYGALWDIRLEKTGSNSLRLEHGYDYVRNVTRVIDSVSGDFTFEYDDLDRLLKRKITGGADQETFTYAAIGNIATKNSLSFSYSSSHKHAVANYNGVDFTYDANGNMIQRGSAQFLKFDAENRLVKVTSDSNGYVYIARMAYDGDGKRAKRVDNYGTIHYAGPHYERNVGTGSDTTEVVTKFYYAQMGAMKRLIAFKKGSALYYVVPDHLGGTLRVVDTAGNTVDDIRYHAFGGARSGGANLQTDKRFTGQTLDASTGLYDFGARSYDGGIGRFCQPDSIVPNPGNPQSLNRYGYGYNNPLRYTDPSGHEPLDDQWRGSFSEAHGRDPDATDEAIRLTSLAYPNEWFGNDLDNKFHNSDGTRNDDLVAGWFQDAPESRSWDTMGSALVSLSGFYSASEKSLFVQDVGFLYAGMPGRRQSTGLRPYWSGGGYPGNLQLYIKSGGINPAYINTTTNDQNDPDANVHHWAWSFNLGYNLPARAGLLINLQHEWGQGRNGRMDQSDIEMGSRGVMMGNALSVRQITYADLPNIFRGYLGVGGPG